MRSRLAWTSACTPDARMEGVCQLRGMLARGGETYELPDRPADRALVLAYVLMPYFIYRGPLRSLISPRRIIVALGLERSPFASISHSLSLPVFPFFLSPSLSLSALRLLSSLSFRGRLLSVVNSAANDPGASYRGILMISVQTNTPDKFTFRRAGE